MARDISLRSLLDTNFMEYASYVIKERAIPHLKDGLKPVQRRILHTLYEIDDHRFHKVANVVGHTMRYHPHGDASIEAALVHIAQRNYLIDQQGNFGNPTTGDPASAARYIECQLSALARETLFNPEITPYVDSYDGRNLEPVWLPAKIPLLLMSGVEGIAVGLSTRILPHNFIELLQAQIAILKGQEFAIYPDLPQGGRIDVSQYQKGQGKVKIRATVNIVDAKTLVIREIPYGTTTESLINSIEKAINKGKLKISTINDFTSDHVEIELKVGHGAKAEDILPRLFLYSDCEVSVSVNTVVIDENHPLEIDIHEVLERNTTQLEAILESELKSQLAKLTEKRFNRKLNRFFIENRIYQTLEKASSLKQLKTDLMTALAPYAKELEREITDADLDRLLSIPIKRISRFDLDENIKEIEKIEKEIQRTEKHLSNTSKYTIDYLKKLVAQYQDLYPRQTQIESFETIDVSQVAVLDIKVGYDWKTKYIGFEVKSEQSVMCSSFDKLMLFFKEGMYQVIDIPDKLFMKKKILYFERQQTLPVFSVIYQEPDSDITLMKRFQVKQFILDKHYRFIPEEAKLLFFTAEEDPIVRVDYAYKKRARTQSEYIHFGRLRVKSVNSMGNRVADRVINKVTHLKRQADQYFENQPPEVLRVRCEPESQPTLFEYSETDSG